MKPVSKRIVIAGTPDCREMISENVAKADLLNLVFLAAEDSFKG